MESLITNLYKHGNEESLINLLTYLREHPIEDYVSFSKAIVKTILELTLSPKIQIEILKVFIDHFFSFSLTKEQMSLIPFRKIFDTKYSFYSQLSQANLLRSYYNYFYPKEEKSYDVGDLIDYLQIEKENEYMWAEAQIIEADTLSEMYTIKLLPGNKNVYDSMDSFRIQPHNKFSENTHKWRSSIVKGDQVDLLDKENNWYKVIVNNNSGFYLELGSRAAIEKMPKNSFGLQQSFGHQEIGSLRIRQKDTFSFDLLYPTLIPINPRENRKYNPHSMHIPFESKYYIIPKFSGEFYSKYSIEYFIIGNYFIQKLLGLMNKEDSLFFTSQESFEHFDILCNIIHSLHEYFNLKFSRVFIRTFIQQSLNYLIELSKTDIIDMIQLSIDSILVILKSIAEMGYYEYEIEIIIHQCEFTLGMNYLQNPILENKLFGLNMLISQFKKLQYDVFQTDKTTILTQQACKINWYQIIEALFTTNYHKEAVKRTTDLIKQLIKTKAITKECMTQIFLLAITKDSIVKHSIYELFTKHTYEIGQDNLFHLIDHLFHTFDPKNITVEEADLLLKLSQGIHIFGNSFIVTVLDYFFNLITMYHRTDFMQAFTELIISKNMWEDMIKLFLSYITKVIEMFSLNNLYDQFKILSFLINSIPKNLEEDIRPQLTQIVFKKSQEKVSALVVDFCQTVIEDQMDILALLVDMLQITRSTSEFLSNNQFIEKLFEIFVESSTIKRNYFFNWLSSILQKNLISIKSLGVLFTLLDSFVNDQNKEIALMPYNDLISFYWNLFLQVNDLNENHLSFNSVNPFELKHSSKMWNLIVNSNERGSLYSKYIDLFALPYMNQNERSGIWKKMIDNILSIMNNSNKINCLKCLHLLISVSEYYGTGGCIPHSFLFESSEMTLSIVNSIIKKNESQFTITLPNNMTLYDLKQLISQKVGVNYHCFSVYSSPRNEDELNSKQNGQTIGSLFLRGSIKTVYLLKSQDLDLIPQERLTIDPWTYNPEAKQVFIDVFTQNSTNGKMSREQLAKVIAIALNSSQMISVDNPNVLITFNKYDTDRDDLITLDEFLSIYLETIRDNNEDAVWQYLKNFNYRNDLKKLTDPLKTEPFINDNPKLMPRYILSQDAYFQMLFQMQNESDCEVEMNVNILINMIESNETIYNEILENCLSGYLLKDNDKDYYIIIYSMRIMNTVFYNAQKEKEGKCIQAFLSQGDTKSSLQLLLELFSNQMEDLTYIHNSRMTMYMLELQLIQKSLIHLINDKNLTLLLLNYSQEKENEMLKIETTEISSIIKTKGNLNFDKVIKIIGANLPLISTKMFQLDIKMNVIKLSFQILLIALLSYGEKELNSFMEIEFKDFLMNQFKIQFPYLQKLAYAAIQIVFAQYQQDLPFLKSIEKIILKEFRLIMSETPAQDYDPSFLVKVYQDMLKLNDYSKEEKAIIIDEFVSLANTSNTSQENILIGYFTILKTLIESTSETQSTKKIISIVLDKFLFGLAFSSENFIKILFDLLTLFITKSADNLILFYSHDSIQSLFNHITMQSPEKRFYHPTEESRDKLGYVGIKNLSAICYMNSVLQQLFQVKAFSFGINEAAKPNERDAILFQLQRMYSYLELTNRKEYSPEEFVHSYRDLNGNPTDFRVQCDAQEFLSRFLEQIENSLKMTPLKYLISGIFGGESCSQLQCLNSSCNKISNRFEHLYYFSLDIKSVSTLQESLSKFIAEEQIEDFGCEQCHNKGVHSKRISFNRLPNVLIIHLQRMSFNFNENENEKIDSRLTFPKDLNLKPYCTETLQTIPLDDDEFNAHVCNKEYDYYQYKLVGVIIHSGTANVGHYYSLINIARDEFSEKWFKFNDGAVSEYSIFNLEEDAFGGEIFRKNEWSNESNQSAYMLVYERIKKTNLFLVTDKELAKDNVIEVKDKAKLTKLIDSTIPIEIKEKGDKNEIEVINNKNSLLPKYYTFKAGENPSPKEYIEIISYDLYCKRVSTKVTQKRIFYDEVISDNMKLINDRKIYSLPFCKLIEASVKEININTDLPVETVICLYKEIHSLLLSVISKSYYKDNITKIVQEMVNIMKTRSFLIEFLINQLCSEDNIYLSFFIFTPDILVGEAFSLYIAEILSASISSNIQSKDAIKFIDGLLDYFPHKLVKKWSQMQYFFEIFNHLAKSNNEQIIKYLIDQGTILKMCEIYLGKDYPYYKGIRSLDSNNQSSPGKFSPLVSAIAILATFSSSLPPSYEEKKCLTCPQFAQKGFDNNYDTESISKIISHFKSSISSTSFNNDNPKKSSLKELVKIVNSADDFDSIKKAFAMVKLMFIHSDENTESCLENLIGITKLTGNKTKICYMSPLDNSETIINKVLTSRDRKYFLEVVELFYDLLLANLQIPRYIRNLLPSSGVDIQYGPLQEINELYSKKIELTKDTDKDEAYNIKINSITKLQLELQKSLELENETIDNKGYELTLLKMNLLKDITINEGEVLYSFDKINCVTLFKSILELNILTENLMENELFHPANRIDLNSLNYYLENNYRVFNGGKVTRENYPNIEGLTNTIVRYFIINTHFNITVTVGINFQGNYSSKFPKTEIIMTLPTRSLNEVIVVRKQDDIPHTITVREIENEANLFGENCINNANQQKKVMFEGFPTTPVNTLYSNSVACPVCNFTNFIGETDTEFKCSHCTAFLFQ